MDWIDSLKNGWSTIVTAACLIIVAVIEAWQQAASGAPVNALPRLDGAWHYAPVILLIVAGASWLIGRHRGPIKSHQENQVGGQSSRGMTPFPTLSALQGQAPQITFNAKEFFRIAYISPLTLEIETNVRTIAEQNQPGDTTGFLARFIGVGLVAVTYNMTWFSIFKSQLLMLAELNRHITLPIAAAKVHYDKAAVDYPITYPKYSFDKWIEYMSGEQLLIRHPSDMLEITHRGRDFLKYLAHWGNDINAKTC
jgi:hypothetical protein